MLAVPFRKNTKAVDDRYFMKTITAHTIDTWRRDEFITHNIHPTRYEDPCAGSGEMSKFFDQIDQYDLNPSIGSNIKQRDFLAHYQQYEPGLCFIMNVPYGYNSSCAIAFFNHAAKFCDYMCITVPKTWGNKYSTRLINRLDRNFVLVSQLDLPDQSFYLPDNNNKSHDVPSVAQIWVRSPTFRPLFPTNANSSSFDVRGNHNAIDTVPDFAIRRVGRNAGDIVTTGFDQLTKGAWWFIFDENIDYPTSLLDIANEVDWKSYGNRMGQRGINKLEVVDALHQALCNHLSSVIIRS